MVASFRAQNGRAAGTGNDLNIPVPTGTVNGDLMIAYGICAAGDTITGPAGWTLRPESVSNQAPIWTRVANSEPASYTFVVSGVAISTATIVTIKDVNPTNPIDSITTSGIVTGNLVLPTITPAGASRLLFQMVTKLTNTSFTGPGSQTERYDNILTSGLNSFCAAGGDEVVSAASGSRTWTPAAGAQQSVGYMVAIAPTDATVSPSGIDSSAALGSPTLTPGDVSVSPSGIDSSAQIGVPTLSPGDVSVSPTGIDSSAALGSPAITVGDVTLSPTGIDSSAVLGSPTLTPGDVTVSPSGIDVSALLGSPTITPGDVFVSPSGIDSSAALGTPNVFMAQEIDPTGIDSSALFGTPTLLRQYVIGGTVLNHETGVPIAGATVRLFDSADVKVAETTTAADGTYAFYLDDQSDSYWTTAQYLDGTTQVHGVSDRGCVPA